MCSHKPVLRTGFFLDSQRAYALATISYYFSRITSGGQKGRLSTKKRTLLKYPFVLIRAMNHLPFYRFILSID